MKLLMILSSFLIAIPSWAYDSLSESELDYIFDDVGANVSDADTGESGRASAETTADFRPSPYQELDDDDAVADEVEGSAPEDRMDYYTTTSPTPEPIYDAPATRSLIPDSADRPVVERAINKKKRAKAKVKAKSKSKSAKYKKAKKKKRHLSKAKKPKKKKKKGRLLAGKKR